jgi:CheY-specific phosphatase CheX
MTAQPPPTAEQLEPALYQVVSDVLEQFAFMFTDPGEDDEFFFRDNQVLQARIVFSGPFSGALSMYATRSFCMQLAANVLGMEPEDLTNEHAHDALKELVNVTCGDFLLHVSGKKTVFDLTVPKIRRLPAEDCTEIRKRTGVIPVLVDEEPVLVQVEIDIPA